MQFPTLSRTNLAVLLLTACLACGWAWQKVQSPARRQINAGLQKMESGRGLEAAIAWREAVKLEPDNAEAWELLGDYHQSVGSWSSALEAFGHVQKIAPTTENLNARMATCALQAQNLAAARRYAEAELKRDPNDIEALGVASSVSGTQHRNDDHLQYLQRLFKLQPQNPTVMLALALEFSNRYDYAAARPLLDKALAMEPDNSATLNAHATALFSDPTPENLQQAKADWEKLLALEPDNIETHRSLGRVALLQNQPRVAIEHFQALGRERPYASAHFVELAKAYRMAGQPAKAQALQNRFAALNQQNRTMQGLKDRIARAPDDLQNYLQLINLQLQSVQNGGDVYELYRYRYENQQIGPPDYYLAQARRLAPQDPQVLASARRLEIAYSAFLQAGLQALNNGDIAAARAKLYRAVVLQPADPRTRSALQKLPADQQIRIVPIPTG